MDIILEDAVNEFTKVYMRDIGERKKKERERERESRVVFMSVNLIFFFFFSFPRSRVKCEDKKKHQVSSSQREDDTKCDMGSRKTFMLKASLVAIVASFNPLSYWGLANCSQAFASDKA
jgi:hypothetical protein